MVPGPPGVWRQRHRGLSLILRIVMARLHGWFSPRLWVLDWLCGASASEPAHSRLSDSAAARHDSDGGAPPGSSAGRQVGSRRSRPPGRRRAGGAHTASTYHQLSYQTPVSGSWRPRRVQFPLDSITAQPVPSVATGAPDSRRWAGLCDRSVGADEAARHPGVRDSWSSRGLPHRGHTPREGRSCCAARWWFEVG